MDFKKRVLVITYEVALCEVNSNLAMNGAQKSEFEN